MVDSDPKDRRESKFLRERIEATKKARGDNKSAQTPWLFASIHQPDCNYLAIPAQFSEKRDYFTAAFLSKDVIASNTLYVTSNPDCFAFSIIESSMFMAWQDLVGGRLEMRKRFSNTLVWNTFPLPALTTDQKDRIIEAGAKVLEARANSPLPLWPTSTTLPICLLISRRLMTPSTKPWIQCSQIIPSRARKRGRRRC